MNWWRVSFYKLSQNKLVNTTSSGAIQAPTCKYASLFLWVWALPIPFSGVILNPGSTTRNQHRWKSLNCGFQRRWKPFSLQFAIVWWKTLPSVCGIALHAMVDTWSMFCDCLLSGWWLVFQNFEQASQERPLLYDYWHHLAAAKPCFPPGEPFIKLIDELLESLNVAFLC